MKYNDVFEGRTIPGMNRFLQGEWILLNFLTVESEQLNSLKVTNPEH